MSDVDPRSAAAWAAYDLPVPPESVPEWIVTGGSLIDRIAARAAGRPGKLALRVAGEELTYAELADRSSRLAAWLRAAGTAPGDRVFIVGQSSANLIVACLAAMWSGGLEVVANPSLTAPELGYLVEDCRPAAVVADADLLAGIAPAVEGLPVAPLSGLDEVLGGVDAGLPAPGLAGDAPASMQYTSGTTGRPKGALLTHANVLAHLRSLEIAWGWSEADVLCHSLPLAHGHGRNGVFTALMSGATAIVLPRTDPASIAEALVRWNATIFYSVPAIWERLLRWEAFDPEAFAGLRLFTSGSAPLSPELSDRVAALLGERPLERYGATETGVVVTNPLGGPRLAGTVGLPVPGAEVRVADPDGRTVDDGEVGEIVARGPAVFAGYWGREAPEDFHPGGWFRTGDLGCFDPERGGHLVITGRSKEMIVTGGLNVYPREIELVAEGLPGVREAVVVGLPSERWGEEVVLAVVPEPSIGAGLDVGGLLSAMRSQLAGYKMPKACKVVGEIPRNHMGKPLRGFVAERWETLGELRPGDDGPSSSIV